MPLSAREGKFVCALLTVILPGSLFTRVAFADDEPKTVPAEQPKKLGTAETETVGQSDSAASLTSAPQETNVVHVRRHSIRYFPAQNTLGLLHMRF